MRHFKKVAVGGTFDELHRGHKILLKTAFDTGEHVAIGLSSDELVSQLSKPHVTATYNERQQYLCAWLKEMGFSSRAQIIPLFDAFGSTVKDPEIEALVVSEQTTITAQKINEMRRKAGLSHLKIVAVTMVPSQNCSPISTTKIRRGEIDHEGRLLKVISKT
jgi:cytidyltransferase-like protein